MRYYHALPVRSPQETRLTVAQSEAHADPMDPASAVFTDLRLAPSVVVPAEEPLIDTRRLMQHAGVRMAFVIDPAGGVIGLVTAADLQGERPMLAAGSRLVSQLDLSVADVMTPVSDWTTLDVESLQNARVGDVVATLRATGARYLIVTELDAAAEPEVPHRTVIRGLFSANRVERALGHPIDEELRSRSFADLAAALAHS